MPVTMRDIATAAGVSRPVVSAVLSGSSATVRVSDAKAKEIRRLADDLGYQKQWRSSVMTGGRTRLIGLLGANFPKQIMHHPGLLSGLTSKLRALDYSLVHAPTDVEAERQSLLDGRFDGVLIDYLVKQDHVETLSRSNLPSLIINAEPRANIPAVRLDEHDSMKVATQHLVELGHERIVYVGMRAVDDLSIASTLEQIRRRSQAWQRLTSETPASRSWMQLDMPSTRYEDPRGAFDASGIAEVLARPAAQRPTAIVAYDWSAALVLVQGIEAIGFSVPGDISVVSLEDDNALRLQRKPITAIDLDFYQLGEDGAQRIASLIETHRDNMPDAVESTATKRVAPQGPVDMLVRSKLAVRESTTKPANA